MLKSEVCFCKSIRQSEMFINTGFSPILTFPTFPYFFDKIPTFPYFIPTFLAHGEEMYIHVVTFIGFTKT